MDDFLFWQRIVMVSTIVAVSAYTVIFAQVFFHNHRIALWGLSGGFVAGMVNELSPGAGYGIGVLTALCVFGFFCYTFAKHAKQVKFWLPMVVLLISGTILLYSFVQLSGTVS